jgi:hypothetical protein
MIFSKPWFTYDVGYPSSLGATGDAHAGFSFHDYCPFASIAALYGLLCPSFNTDVFSNADRAGGRYGCVRGRLGQHRRRPGRPVPVRHQVVVSGAKVVSEGGILTLASCPGATKVTLTVQPGSGVTNGC